MLREQTQIPFEIYPENATEQIQWESNPYVTIDENGVATFSPPEGEEQGSATGIIATIPSSGQTYGLWTQLSYEKASDTSGICGANASWSLEGSTLIISGTGDIYGSDWDASSASNSSWGNYNAQITDIQIQPGITGIGELQLEVPVCKSNLWL
mgnify:CR=1 FL=1